MTKYLLRRIIGGIFSVIVVVAIVMLLVYGCLDREIIFSFDPVYSKQVSNSRTVYRYRQWEKYGYLDYVHYTEYLSQLVRNGEINDETRIAAQEIATTANGDSAIVKQYVDKFTEYYKSQGYTVTRLNADIKGGKLQNGGAQQLFAYKDIGVFGRMWNYFTNIITVDNIHNATGDVGERGITFTFFDPAYGGKKFSPAIMGNGTTHKYLLYFDNRFPFIHQNLITVQLGQSTSIRQGIDVWDTMMQSQGGQVIKETVYPTGYTEMSADDLHTAVYVEGSNSTEFTQTRFTDDYTSVSLRLDGQSKISYSFVIGIISVIIAYVLGLPLGVLMARTKDKLPDILGTVYIIFIIAVPSLAYIFMFRALGGSMGIPTSFDTTALKWTMYILPIVSLALPSIASLMKWMRRYMIDQENSDYVKFARSGGLSEREIFRKHIFKNAMIPLVHGIPGSILGALTGAIITERVYVVPGVGNLLTQAINRYDNAVIVGVTLFYAVLSVISLILGDILMSLVDPRISFTTKGR